MTYWIAIGACALVWIAFIVTVRFMTSLRKRELGGEDED